MYAPLKAMATESKVTYAILAHWPSYVASEGVVSSLQRFDAICRWIALRCGQENADKLRSYATLEVHAIDDKKLAHFLYGLDVYIWASEDNYQARLHPNA